MTRSISFVSLKRTVVIALLCGVGLLASPQRAWACYDGYYARVGDSATATVELHGTNPEWDLATARRLGVWLARMAMLVPPGDRVVLDGDIAVHVAPERKAPGDSPWPLSLGNARPLAGTFEVLAAHYNTPKALVQRARQHQPKLLTVQLGAFRDRAAAQAFARRAHDGLKVRPGTLHGYYEAGAFPAENDPFHIIEAEDKPGMWRVIVGAFLSAKDAQRAQRALGEGYVRPL